MAEDDEDEVLEKLREEVESWKTKFKQMELKKRESDLALNKIKTEINSLRSVDKLWKDSAKVVYANMKDVKHQFDIQIDQVINGLSMVGKAGERISAKVPLNRILKDNIAQLQYRIATQEETIMTLNGKIRLLTAELQDKTKKVERLSQGIEEEVERLNKPMRDKLTDCMVQIMKEKATRAQDLREIADIWPEDKLMPSKLMRYRALTPEERERRRKMALEQNASYALAAEIRANVMESKLWELKYDDYGRPFYQHMKTGETNWETPEILSYKPPPGRDEMGNLLVTEDGDVNNYTMHTDPRGQVFWISKLTGQKTFIAPYAYQTLPTGKTKEQHVGEAAQLVLSFIREKVSRHIEKMRKLQESTENPMTFEERRKKEKEDRNKTVEERAAEELANREEPEVIELGLYRYDIETVEMLADSLNETALKALADKDPEAVRAEKREFLAGSEVRKFDASDYVRPTLAELDMVNITVQELRGYVEDLSAKEEKLEVQLDRTRERLKDFTFVLVERVAKEDAEREEALRAELEAAERERKAQEKQFLLDQKVKEKERQEELERQRRQRTAMVQSRDEEDEEDYGDEEAETEGGHSRRNSIQFSIAEDSTGQIVPLGASKKQRSRRLSRFSDTSKKSSKSRRSSRQFSRKSSLSKAKSSIISGGMDIDSKSGKEEGPPAEGADADEFSDEEEEQEEGDHAEDVTFKKTDYGALLFGNPVLDPIQPDASEENLETAGQLTNFAMFCGFVNLHPSEAPYDSTVDYSLLHDHKHVSSDEFQVRDDSWLSKSFFLKVSREDSDGLREMTSKMYDSDLGLLPIGPLDSEHIVVDGIDKMKSRTATTRIQDEVLEVQFMQWKARQLFGEVLRSQIQKEAIREAALFRRKAFYNVNEAFFPHIATRPDMGIVQLQVLKVVFHKYVKFKAVTDNSYYVQVSLGNWSSRTHGIAPSPHPFHWEELATTGFVPVNDVQVQDMLLEILDDNPEDPEKSFICSNAICIQSVMGGNVGRDMVFAVEMLSQDNKAVGNLQFTVCVNFKDPVMVAAGRADWKKAEDQEAPAVPKSRKEDVSRKTVVEDAPRSRLNSGNGTPAEASRKNSNEAGFVASRRNSEVRVESRRNSVDAAAAVPSSSRRGSGDRVEEQPVLQQEDRLEVNLMEDPTIALATTFDRGAKQAAEEFLNNPPKEEATLFSALVSDLRGDGVHFIRMLVGDVTAKDIQRVISRADKAEDLVQKLPNFSNATEFLWKKTNLHRWEIDRWCRELEEAYKVFEECFRKKKDSVTRQNFDAKMRLKKIMESVDDMQADVQRVQKTVRDLRRPNPSPKEPVFPELPPVPYVPKMPVTGGLDNRGKKKKQIPAAELKVLMDTIESGDLDGKDMFTYPEPFWPSQAQQQKLQKAINARNAVLDDRNSEELKSREGVMVQYRADVEKWEAAEAKRNRELERAKRDCRKINLKYDGAMERSLRAKKECENLEMDSAVLKDIETLHAKSVDRFKMMRYKQFLEWHRQTELIDNLKKRLLRAVRARQFAIELPSTAKNALEFEHLTRKAEEALRVIRTEVFDCRQLLLAEGARLRAFFREETNLCQCELTRVKLSKEMLTQRECFDKILERYKFEVMHLMVDLEKFRVIESDRDETGVDTVDDLGERYVEGKVWTSPEASKTQRLIDVYMAKINLTEGLGASAGYSQKIMMDVLAAKYGADLVQLRDTWSESSDFERGQQLLHDAIQWVAIEHKKLNEKAAAVEKEKVDLNLQLQALKEQQDLAANTYELETRTITSNSTDIIAVMRNYLDSFREECRGKINTLEASIIDLSRECQKVREKLLAQELAFDEKTKVLWAFIHTLQTTLQQMSARMEMVMEERERIVIQSKLIADKMRHQLRIERKHNATLKFIIHSQRGFAKYLHDVIRKLALETKKIEMEQKKERTSLKKEIWEQVFSFSRLSTDIDALFEFFAARLANLAGSRASMNDALARNGAAMVLSALCKSPRPLIRKFAARALGGMGWNGFIETRIIMWDCVMHWKIFKARILAGEEKEFKEGFARFNESGRYEALLNIHGEVEEFQPAGNMSLRTIIKQRRQWALRAARRREGPNVPNQQLLNVKDGVLPSLMQMALSDGKVDWEIARNAALAISIASFEPHNHHDITHDQFCVDMIIRMCCGGDAEVQTHAAVTIANLCHKDEESQLIFGRSGAVVALIDMCRSTVVDVLEAATAALSNISSSSDINCKHILDAGGVPIMVRVITQSCSENLLDLDQNDEVQANASEILANISRYNTDETVRHFSGEVIDAMVVLCASKNKQLRRHIPLAIGNVAQTEKCREEIGERGGIEALFLLLEDEDTTIQANGLWALCNLMWHPPNQERAGRFMSDIIAFLHSPFDPTRRNASTLLANVLYYNTANRVRLLEIDEALELLLTFIEQRPDVAVVEGALRSLLSLCFLDSIAMWVGVERNFIPTLISHLRQPYLSRDCMRYALETLENLCLHHANRRIIYDNGGIDAIVSLHIDQNPQIRERSVNIIEHLEDITPAEVLARIKQDIGLERMVTMATSEDPLIRAVAAESIGEEVWRDPSKQKVAHSTGAVEALLAIVRNPNEPLESVLPALWSLRNIMFENPDAQTQFDYRDGFVVVGDLVKRAFTGVFVTHTDKVFEGALACFSVAASKHARNSRKLVMTALDAIMDLSDSKLHSDSEHVRRALKSESVKALADSLMLLMEPFNYVVCKHCGRKQNLHGTTCICCRPLLVEVERSDTEAAKARPPKDMRELLGSKSEKLLPKADGRVTKVRNVVLRSGEL